MPEPDAFDPTHALDGWRLPAPAPVPELDLDTLLHPGPKQTVPLLTQVGATGFDPTHLLDGWRPPAPAPLDLELKSMLRAGPVPDEAKMARLKARGYEMLDVEDVELVEAPPAPRVVVEPQFRAVPPAPPWSEDAVPAEHAVDLPLPDEEVWPLFTAEAQILDAGAAPAADVETPVPQAAPQPEIETMLPSAAEASEAPAPLELPEAEAVAPEIEAPEAEPVVEPAPIEAESLAGIAAVAAVETPVSEDPVEPPVLDFHASPPLASPPTPRFIDDIHLPSVPPAPPVAEAPVLDFRVAPPPAVVGMPELDIAALTPRPPEPDPRLLGQWRAGAWTARARQVAGASEELLQTPQGPRVESHAPQWLCAIWPPQAQDAPLGRWPELASLVAAETADHALQQLLDELPDEAPLWSAELDADWDLVAELVLHQDAEVRPAQAQALRELAETERRARLARLSEGYALQGRVARRRA
ncbi:MAG TPA: hypothetical protein VIN03_24385 [Roseateles sp.]